MWVDSVEDTGSPSYPYISIIPIPRTHLVLAVDVLDSYDGEGLPRDDVKVPGSLACRLAGVSDIAELAFEGGRQGLGQGVGEGNLVQPSWQYPLLE